VKALQAFLFVRRVMLRSLINSYFLTPWLVGDKIGLHPVVVIFAVLAGGQLFGIVGVLLALPASSVIAVLIREAVAVYKQSEVYLK
jgi:predicted PurR-regulated permease PerM